VLHGIKRLTLLIDNDASGTGQNAAPKGRANGAYKHGLYTQQAKAERRLISDLLRQCRKTIAGDL
jgi:hypothetical protein